MRRHHHSRRQQTPRPSPPIIITVTDRDSDMTTPARQTGRRETCCLTWSNLALGALIPLMIGIGTVVITLQQQKNEDRRFQQTQDNEDRRRDQDQHIANWTREQDQQQADNLHYQNVYSRYIIDISNAIFKQQNCTETFVDNRTRFDYIRIQTLTALVDLDCQRKTWLFEFLDENQLLPSLLQSTSLKLRGANLSCITLKSTISKKYEFHGLELPSVDLENASFIKCSFFDGVNFTGSLMENITFTQSIFNCSDGKARLEHAMLSHTNFYDAYLCNVSFNGTDLSYADFTKAVFQGTIDLTGTDLAFTTFKDVGVHADFSMIINNANMTGASILEDKWFNGTMKEGQIEMMNVILPNGTWLLNETVNLIRNGNAEKNCTSLVIPNWDSYNSRSDITSPALSIIHRNDSTNSSLESCCFNFTCMTTVNPIFMGQLILLHHISKFIQSSEAEYHLSFDTKCQGGCMEINLQFYASETSAPLQSQFCFNGTDQLYWQKQIRSEKIPVNTVAILLAIGRTDHTGLCYVDNIELSVRRRRSNK